MTTSKSYYLRQQKMQIAGYKAHATRIWQQIAKAPSSKTLELLARFNAIQSKLAEFA